MIPSARRPRWLLGVGALAVVAAGVAGWAAGAPGLLRQAVAVIQDPGLAGAGAFVALYVVATVLLLPGSILTLGAGAVFGLARGVLVSSIGATLGATAAFLVGRHLAREAVGRWIEGSARLRAIDEALAREGWTIIALARLSPVLPFNVLNYAFGVTRIPLGHYVVATWAGMLPWTVTYVYLGWLAGDLATLGQGASGRTPAEWALFALGLVAAVAVTVRATQLARSAFAQRLGV